MQVKKEVVINITEDEQQEYLAYKTYEDVLNSLKEGLEGLEILDIKKDKKRTNPTLVCGGMAAFDKELPHFLNEWNKTEHNLFLLSEVTAQFRRYTDNTITFPYICTPHLLAKEMIILNMEIPVTEDMILLCKNVEYVREAVENLEMRHNALEKGYALMWAYYAYHYINKLLDILAPSKVVLWNEFYAFHHIFGGVCKSRNIPLYFMEYGCIPGTICIEDIGQQGESIIARESEYFSEQKINLVEYTNAKIIIKYLKLTGLNRNIQPNIRLGKNMLHRYIPGRKTVAYIGQNDYESGLCPYTERSIIYHSPIFKSTLDALEYISILAIKNDWNMIYKPHPIMLSLQKELEHLLADGKADILEEVNLNSLIDFSDLTITILSQSAYIALIRDKPVLMLGYTQLKSKKCTYEAFSVAEIENAIHSALKRGYTKMQKKSFLRHVAQLLKYYLYDDNNGRMLRFGKDINKINLDDI